jgi:hypothetical protein
MSKQFEQGCTVFIKDKWIVVDPRPNNFGLVKVQRVLDGSERWVEQERLVEVVEERFPKVGDMVVCADKGSPGHTTHGKAYEVVAADYPVVVIENDSGYRRGYDKVHFRPYGQETWTSKVGDPVVCVDTGPLYTITYGKTYEVLGTDSFLVAIENDEGDILWHNKSFFYPVTGAGKAVEVAQDASDSKERFPKIGESIVCTYKGCYRHLTKGRAYEVIDIDSYTVLIKNDAGEVHGYPPANFEPVMDNLVQESAETGQNVSGQSEKEWVPKVGDRVVCVKKGVILTLLKEYEVLRVESDGAIVIKNDDGDNFLYDKSHFLPVTESPFLGMVEARLAVVERRLESIRRVVEDSRDNQLRDALYKALTS